MDDSISIVLTVVAYLTLVSTVGLLVLSPALRARLDGMLRRCIQGALAFGGSISGSAGRMGQSARVSGGGWLSRWYDAARNNRWLLMAACCILLTPLILVTVLRKHVDAGSFEDTATVANPVIAQLLQGEQLLPPSPLPPDAFNTREVEQERPMLVSASRDWALLDSEFRQRLLIVFRLMEEQHGYKMVLLEGYRSPSRQNTLSAMGGSVTNAAAFQSYHQYGLASDCAFMRDGKIVITEKDPWAMRGYELYGEVAESAGLTWGGRWKLHDLGHVELRRAGVLGKPAAVPPGAAT